MTMLGERTWSATSRAVLASKPETERRKHRRHDFEAQTISVDRWDTRRRQGTSLGRLVDLSSGGVKIRTTAGNIRPDQQIRVRLELPSYAGISPFIDTSAGAPKPKNEWIGWMAVSRVRPTAAGEYEVAGRLMEMEDLDRGMLSLYLSTQPMAA